MNGLISEIRLKKSEIESASNAKNYLFNILDSKSANGLIPVPKDIFLTGSYIRGTKLTPLDDIDLFYVIGHAFNRDGNWHTIIDCSFDFGTEYLDLDNNISSIKILELIKRVLVETYPSSDLKRNGEVVNLYLSSYDLSLDIVPAFKIGNSNYFLIPNGSNSSKWKKSNPLTDQKIVDDLHTFHNYYFKDIVRIAKFWFKQKKIKSPRSYHLESAAYHIFSNTNPLENHVKGLETFYRNFGNYLLECPDPTGLSDPITSNLEQEEILKIILEMSKALDHLSAGEEAFIDYVRNN